MTYLAIFNTSVAIWQILYILFQSDPLRPPLSTLPFPTQFNGVQVQEEMLNVAFQVLRGDVLASRGQPYMLNWLLEKLY